MTVLIVLSLVLFALLVDYAVQLRQSRQLVAHPQQAPAMQPRDYFLPDGIFLAASHLWGLLMPSGVIRFGIDPFVLNSMGKPDQVILPEKGAKIKAGQPLLELVQNNRRLRMLAPADGTVEELNAELLKNAHVLHHREPLTWAVTIKPVELSKTLSLMRLGEDAKNWVNGEIRRFRDFLAVHHGQTALAPALQDGGLPVVGALQSLDESVWQKFEAEFLNPSER